MRISVGSDHRGLNVKAKLIASIENLGHEVDDVGAFDSEPVDYPDFAKSVCESIVNEKADRGVLICGTGMGMAIAANKYRGVRAANCYDEVMAEICRRHNNVNVLCLPGDLIGERPVDDLVRIWLSTEFDEGRHQRRIEKIADIENGQILDSSEAN